MRVKFFKRRPWIRFAFEKTQEHFPLFLTIDMGGGASKPPPPHNNGPMVNTGESDSSTTINSHTSNGLHLFQLHWGTFGTSASLFIIVIIAVLLSFLCFRYRKNQRRLRAVQGPRINAPPPNPRNPDSGWWNWASSPFRGGGAFGQPLQQPQPNAFPMNIGAGGFHNPTMQWGSTTQIPPQPPTIQVDRVQQQAPAPPPPQESTPTPSTQPPQQDNTALMNLLGALIRRPARDNTRAREASPSRFEEMSTGAGGSQESIFHVQRERSRSFWPRHSKRRSASAEERRRPSAYPDLDRAQFGRR